MKSEFWNSKYSDKEFFYGTEPNEFIRAQYEKLPAGGRIFEPACGEGRNAVFLAEKGFQVTAADFSDTAIAKTDRLAQQKGVSVDTVCCDIFYWAPERRFDGNVVTFMHMPPEKKTTLFRRLASWLMPGGVLIGEFFHPDQRLQGKTSGGPPFPEMMYTADELREIMSDDFNFDILEETTVDLNEGPGHSGEGHVTRVVAIRK